MNPAEAYIINKQEPYRSILLQLQMVIESKFPEIALKYKWRIPFYYLHNKPFCYLNVNLKKKYVDLVFCNGKQLDLCGTYLFADKRKKMASLRYTSLQEINIAVINLVLEASKKEM
ncbi:MAG: DUF1801 domain-containing protein [Oceanihabitans sp.]